MNWLLAPRSVLLKGVGILFMLVMAGCANSPNYDAAYLRGKSSDALRLVEAAEAREKANPAEALAMYQRAVSNTKIKQKFSEYQKTFSEDVEAFQRSQGYGGLREDSGLGIPEVYARQILALTQAHLGLARIFLKEKNWSKAESEATEAMSIAKRCEFCPYLIASNHKKANRILERVYEGQGAFGKALIRKLNADLLEDHLASEGGIEEFYIEKKVILGEQSLVQVAAVERLFDSATAYQAQQQQASAMAVTGGLMALNAGLQQGMAQAALVKSGGVMTPEAQMAQNNARLAEMQSHMFMNMAAAQARAGPKTLQVSATPWAIPTFTQQLVDPKQGAKTPIIMKGFTTNASQAGGTSYQDSAQQVNQAVDALSSYRQSGKMDGSAAQVEKFAEVFNAFLAQVQEIKK